MKILLVEDNVQASNAVKDYFTQKGHEVIQAYNGIKGLEIINDYKFDYYGKINKPVRQIEK